MSELDEVLADLSAFADEESEAAVDSDGNFILQRNGVELAGVLRPHPDGQLLVETEGSTFPYVRYLTHNLARLDVLAQRLIERRSAVPGFVNAQVSLQRAAADVVRGGGLTLLDEECSKLPPFPHASCSSLQMPATARQRCFESISISRPSVSCERSRTTSSGISTCRADSFSVCPKL